MTDIEKHFINSAEDLKIRAEKGSQYDLIKASGILRQFLIDSPSLIDRANERHKKKILFTTNRKENLESKAVIQDGVQWEPMITVRFIEPKDKEFISELKRPQFLQYQVFHFEDHIFTIKDIIKIAANVLGGVHYDKPKTNEDRLLAIANSMINYQDKTSACAYSIREIANVTIKAIKPLLDKINNGE